MMQAVETFTLLTAALFAVSAFLVVAQDRTANIAVFILSG
jgi:hypothetical protein